MVALAAHNWLMNFLKSPLRGGPNFPVLVIHGVVPAKLATRKSDGFVLSGKRSHGPAARAHNAPCSRH
jgi:hypothetical protein